MGKKGKFEWRVSYLYNLSTFFLTNFAHHNIRKRTMVTFEIAPGELYLAESEFEQNVNDAH